MKARVSSSGLNGGMAGRSNLAMLDFRVLNSSTAPLFPLSTHKSGPLVSAQDAWLIHCGIPFINESRWRWIMHMTRCTSPLKMSFIGAVMIRPKLLVIRLEEDKRQVVS